MHTTNITVFPHSCLSTVPTSSLSRSMQTNRTSGPGQPCSRCRLSHLSPAHRACQTHLEVGSQSWPTAEHCVRAASRSLLTVPARALISPPSPPFLDKNSDGRVYSHLMGVVVRDRANSAACTAFRVPVMRMNSYTSQRIGLSAGRLFGPASKLSPLPFRPLVLTRR